MKLSPLVQLENLELRYKGSDFKAVDSVSLEINTGEILGLVGPNGAGKTSLISMISGLIRPSGGKIYIQGLDSAKEMDKIKPLIGIVPQDYALYPELSAVENLRFFGSLYGVKRKTLNQSIEEGLEQVKLSPFASQKIKTFSGGMKRRVNLLAALLHRPALLLLDEPTVGVDVQSKIAIIDYLKLLQKQGTGMIYCSHILHEVQAHCTHIALLQDGKIKRYGTTEELFSTNQSGLNLESLFIQEIQNDV